MEHSMKVLLIEDDLSEVERYRSYFDTQDDITLVGTTGSAKTGLLLVQRHYPDAIILDLELDEGSGIQFMPQLRRLELPFRPYVLVTTWTSEYRTLQKLKDDGVGFVQLKSRPGYKEYGPQMVTELLRELRAYIHCDPDHPEPGIRHVDSPAELEKLWTRQIKEVMGRLGITSGLVAHNYFAMTICLTARYIEEHGEMPVLDKHIHPVVDRHYGLRPGSTEKSMRAAIEKAWKETDPETLAREYTQYVSPEKGKPELKDFIIYYAEKLI